MPRKPRLTKQPDEDDEEFALRKIQRFAYYVAHDRFCPFGEGIHTQYHDAGPYEDESRD